MVARLPTTFRHQPSGAVALVGVAKSADLTRGDAENLGGDIELMLNRRALIGAFPWRYQGLEGCPCRIVAFLDAGEDIEAVGNAAKAIMAG